MKDRRRRNQADGAREQPLPGRASQRVARHSILLVDGITGASGPKVEKHNGRRQAGGQHPPEKCEQQWAEADHGVRAEREGLGQVGRGLLEDAHREHIAGEQAEDRCDHPQAQRLEEDHLHDAGPTGAGHAQIGDGLAAVGDSQQHRVEREQQPEQCPDGGEQPAGETAGPQGLAQKRDVLIGAAHDEA